MKKEVLQAHIRTYNNMAILLSFVCELNKVAQKEKRYIHDLCGHFLLAIMLREEHEEALKSFQILKCVLPCEIKIL